MKREKGKGKRNKISLLIFSLFIFNFSIACTFDYGETASAAKELPDLVMRNVEYVRVRSADPIARVQAEIAERYDEQGVMKLQNFSFEQFGRSINEVNSFGRAGNAEVDINSGDIFMNNGVRLEVESEDIIIETPQLDWKDEPRVFFTGDGSEVTISRENGTSFKGMGLSADARRRTWEFTGNVTGSYIHNDEEDETESDTIFEEETE